MKIGSLFDGSGGFPLAASLCGIEPVWASEVEPYPIAVTRSRFPNMKHLGDVSKINGAKVEPVDVITFGSPCQDLSVAGKRAGLKYTENGDDETTRSGLFMEAVRIIKEMREVTHGKYPRFAVWENVPGAFSSNKGEDFRTVLEELIKIVEPTAVMPEVPKSGWAYADSFCGNGWSLAWRVFDAQYIRTAQRRRRIYLVLDLGGQCAREVLFERESLRGYSAEIGASREETARDVGNCIEATDRKGNGVSNAEGGICVVEPIPYTLKIRSGCEGGGKGALIQNDKSATLSTLNDQHEVAPCLSANKHDACVCYSIENHPADSRVDIDESGKVQTLTGRMGTGGGNVPLVMESKPVYCLQGSMVGRDDKNGPQGDGVNEETCFTLNTIDRHVRRLTPTECARLQGFPDRWGDIDPKEDFTDEEYHFWLDVRNTHAAINGKTVKDYTKKQMLTWYNKLHTDSAEYKMWGNGIALPCALYVMQGIQDALEVAV